MPTTPEAVEGQKPGFERRDHLIKIKFEQQDHLINIKAIWAQGLTGVFGSMESRIGDCI